MQLARHGVGADRASDAVLSFGVCAELVCCGYSDGSVSVWDMRRAATPLYTLHSHPQGTCLLHELIVYVCLSHMDWVCFFVGRCGSVAV